MRDPANTDGVPVTHDTVKSASELRDLLRQTELAIADLRRGTGEQAAEAVRTMHVIEKSIPRLEQQFGVELKAERSRLQTLEGAFRSNAALLVRKVGRSRFEELRREVGAGNEDWWMRLDVIVAEERSQRLRRLGLRLGVAAVAVVILAVAYQVFLAPSSNGASDRLRSAESYLTQGQLETALAEYMAALEDGAEGFEAPLAIGAILTQLGRSDEAQQYLDRARQQLSQADYYANLSLIYYKMASQGGVDAADKAEEAALAAVEADDTSAMAYLALGSVYEMQGEVGKAIEALDRASTLTTDAALTASIKMRLGMLSQRPGELPGVEAEVSPKAE
ncbi:MAG: tetratricopeptide repeat protein [Anaerolineae bacterium]|nr:tetratricopeptide repeat protein [Anaerolineae bacterium]